MKNERKRKKERERESYKDKREVGTERKKGKIE